MNCKEMAYQHWQWVQGLLETEMNTSTFVSIATAEYLYKTAFIHGYKHALEEYDIDDHN